MIKPKIVVIVGARPQFIKLSALSAKLSEYFDEVIIHTGQHYDDSMSSIFFDELNIQKPKYNLGIGSGRQGLQTAKMLESIEEILIKETPVAVVVFGDTNSTLAGALAASKLGISIIHIEAGLRSFNREMPEEINRVVTDHVSDLLLAPTKLAMTNLKTEGLISKSVLSGDIMVDSTFYNQKKALERSEIINQMGLVSSEYYLATLHRPYNVDDPEKLNQLLNEFNLLNKTVVFPIHPRTKNVISQNGIKIGSNIKIIEPQGFLDFLCLLSHCNKIITDSGGIQKEAYILKKPCITLRTETEWVETVEAGWNYLLSDFKNIHQRIEGFNPDEKHIQIYGENVAEKMISEIRNLIN